jgi:hypothetical protein
MEPILEKAEARRPASNAPDFDETYSFGGLPTGRENYTGQRGVPGDGRDERRYRSGCGEAQVRARLGQQKPKRGREER